MSDFLFTTITPNTGTTISGTINAGCTGKTKRGVNYFAFATSTGEMLYLKPFSPDA